MMAVYKVFWWFFFVYLNMSSFSAIFKILSEQVWEEEEDVFPGSSKNHTIKASTKLFLFHRLKSKKQKNNKSSGKDENRIIPSAPELDATASPKVSESSWKRKRKYGPYDTTSPSSSVGLSHVRNIVCLGCFPHTILI